MASVVHYQAEFGSRASRFLASLLDNILIYLMQIGGGYVGAIIGAVIRVSQDAPESIVHETASQGMYLGMFFWSFVGWFMNYGVIQGLTGSSLGKRVCGIQVICDDGRPIGIRRSLLRSLCYMISWIPLYLGFVAIFWSEKRQCWHDVICKTLVIRRPPEIVATPVLAAVQQITQSAAEPAASVFDDEDDRKAA